MSLVSLGSTNFRADAEREVPATDRLTFNEVSEVMERSETEYGLKFAIVKRTTLGPSVGEY